MKKIGFIGMGNMGQAMLKGCLNVFKAEDLLFTALLEKDCQAVSEKTGVEYVMDSLKCAEAVKYVVLAIKPQVYPTVLAELQGKIKPEQVVISIAPSYSIAQVKAGLGEGVRVVRAMPNTPAMVGEGMSGVCFSEDNYTDDEKVMVQNFFSAFGKMEVVPESLINAVTAASGSSPAFVYMFIEALADGAVKFGMPRDKAYVFAAQAVMGSAKMVLETGEHPGKLKDNVCSPGGTTIDGVAVLEERGFRSAIIEAASAVYDKCNNM
ncbi:MAG: pyrroline-5-carboxylate reductase [Clostridia bacterium]|nr:pyrroline-5-carboxylate reductase [Lachnospiraceae bacterium]NCB99999.1 pyrroline-5-carboxylate reductase [Clostridia bacterium]NCD03542.1 pyrroline-5-carboxylate reductase [Clostridia bacterium]